MKIRQTIIQTIILFSILFSLLIICPLQDGLKGFEIIFTDYHLAVAYLTSIIACLLLIVRRFIKNTGITSLILFNTSALFYLFHLISNEYFNVFIFLAIFFDFSLAIALLFILNTENEFSVRDIAEMAMLVALAIGLDLPGLKIQIGANGGSISFTMIPLLIIALRLGMFKGFIAAGIIYGSITSVLDGWGMQYYLFDYLLAYGSLAVIGLFSKQILREDKGYPWMNIIFLVVGVILAITLRLAFATLSGVIFYETGFVESLIYNSLYILPSGGGALVVLILLLKPLMIVNKRFPVKSTTL